MINPDHETLLEKYLSNELTDSEEKEFERLYNCDPNFKEDVEAQKLLIESLSLLRVKNEITDRFKGFHEEESKPESKVVALWKKKSFLSIAASLTLLITVSALALFYFKPFWKGKDTPNQTQVSKTEVPTKSQFQIHDFNYQRAILSTQQSNTLIGGLGTGFSIPTGSFVDKNNNVILDSVVLDLAEIINPDDMKLFVAGNSIANHEPIRMFYVNPFYQGKEVQINNLAPIAVALPAAPGIEISIYYGGKDLNNLKWTPPTVKNSDFIAVPDKIMEDYKRYLASINLLDSVRQNYVFNGEYYVPKNLTGSQIQLSSEFIDQTKNYINRYRNSTNFDYKVSLAKRRWAIYNAQRKIDYKINNSKPKEQVDERNSSTHYYLYEPGWYILTKQPK